MMLPTSLYIHIPWCIRKCPYCDFNSHKSSANLPEDQYIDALIADFEQDLHHHQPTAIASVFIGGGTPSLFSAQAYERLFKQLRQRVNFASDIEITLEANPGTVEQQRFRDYRAIGINRLSLGIQSFNAQHLTALGRIHDDRQAHTAIEAARLAGFDNINLDIMHSLPQQSLEQGLSDLTTALQYQPEHLSWYQLTLEPNTVFYKQQPPLPSEEMTCALEEQGIALLTQQGYNRYEISAFSQPGLEARHNMNYWLFGDYFGIGAGAHGKLSSTQGPITRTAKHRQPQEYLNADKPFLTSLQQVDNSSLLFEFMLNTTRLEQAIPMELFSQRTGLALDNLMPLLQKAAQLGLLSLDANSWQITPLGRRYTNNLQALFLPE